MRITYYQDETLDLDLNRLCLGLNDLSGGVQFNGEHKPTIIRDKVISHPKSYKSLGLAGSLKIGGRDLALICTTKSYDNNYFYEFDDNIGILSFAGWDHLTELPIVNGG